MLLNSHFSKMPGIDRKMMWKVKRSLKRYSTAPSLKEKEMEDEVSL